MQIHNAIQIETQGKPSSISASAPIPEDFPYGQYGNGRLTFSAYALVPHAFELFVLTPFDNTAAVNVVLVPQVHASKSYHFGFSRHTIKNTHGRLGPEKINELLYYSTGLFSVENEHPVRHPHSINHIDQLCILSAPPHLYPRTSPYRPAHK